LLQKLPDNHGLAGEEWWSPVSNPAAGRLAPLVTGHRGLILR